MKTTTDKTAARITSALNSQGVSLYRHESSYPESDATRNLRDRTHYVDADTLKCFKARILNSGHSADGLLYWLVESVQSRPNANGWTRRAVVFDVFGNTVADTRDTWHKTTDQATAAALAAVATFPAPKHTIAEIKARAQRQIQQARATLKALAGKA